MSSGRAVLLTASSLRASPLFVGPAKGGGLQAVPLCGVASLCCSVSGGGCVQSWGLIDPGNQFPRGRDQATPAKGQVREEEGENNQREWYRQWPGDKRKGSRQQESREERKGKNHNDGL